MKNPVIYFSYIPNNIVNLNDLFESNKNTRWKNKKKEVMRWKLE